MKGGLRRLDVVKSFTEFMKLLSHCKIKLLTKNLIECNPGSILILDMGNQQNNFYWVWMGKAIFNFQNS